MFSLIITIISIALVAALALATIYYGGDAFSNGGNAATAAEAINGSQQIAAADTLQKAQTGQGAGTLGELVANSYLAAVPSGDWIFAGGQALRTDLSEDVCLAANKKLGIDVVPLCSNPAYASTTVCCQVSD